jgi:hypothetical protein
MDARICSLFLEPYQFPLARSSLFKVDRSPAIRCTRCPEGAAASRSRTTTRLNARKSASKRGVQWSSFRDPKQILVEAKGDLS